MIQVSNLTKKYGKNVAVDNVSFTIEKGHIYGLLGPNGAGKSTTMNMITGYISSTSGTITIDGHDVVKEPEQARKLLGYLPELPPLYMDMTVYEYLKFVAQLKKIKRKERIEQVEKAIEQMKLEKVADRLIANLSKGYRQRVGFAQALIGDPQILILDEPSVGLDPKQIIEMRELIEELGQNRTVILSSHIMQEISAVCDHILIISHGKLIASGTVEELVAMSEHGEKLEVTIEGDKELLEDLFSQIDCVESVKITEHDGVATANVVMNKGAKDIRKDVYIYFKDKNASILNMNLVKTTLEDIFLELTMKADKEENIEDEELITTDENIQEAAPESEEEGSDDMDGKACDIEENKEGKED